MTSAFGWMDTWCVSTLIVTSARFAMATPDDVEGATVAIETGARGLPGHRYAG